jgi:hypothetical protein
VNKEELITRENFQGLFQQALNRLMLRVGQCGPVKDFPDVKEVYMLGLAHCFGLIVVDNTVSESESYFPCWLWDRSHEGHGMSWTTDEVSKSPLVQGWRRTARAFTPSASSRWSRGAPRGRAMSGVRA